MIIANLPNPLIPTLPLILETEDLINWNWKAVLAILLLIVLLYLFFYFVKAQKKKPELGYMKKIHKEFDITERIYEIRKRTLSKATYLKGVFELSEILREYIQAVNFYPRPITAMTVEELKKILESKNTIRVFEVLRDIQFSNSPVTQEIFEDMVKETEVLTKEKYFAVLKKR
ncbi:MAG: hypothetical protein N3A69_17530 [Leptospiraceae bacterium]|nr:hypothetical protein [Leptospiraceae bacterium]